MRINWRDVTSYSRDEKRGENPRIWQLVLGSGPVSVEIRVHRHIDYGDSVWLLSSRDLGITMVQLKAKDCDKAKAEAIEVAGKRARIIAGLFPPATGKGEGG
jgi:hypothetical protein